MTTGWLFDLGKLNDLLSAITTDPTLYAMRGYGGALWLGRKARRGDGPATVERIGALRLTKDGNDLATGPLRKALDEPTRKAVARAVCEWRQEGGAA